MSERKSAGGGRLSHEQLSAELGRARAHIIDLEAHSLHSREGVTDSLVQHLQDGFSLLTPDGVHLDVNPSLCAMTGFSREELIGAGLPHPYWPPEEAETIARAIREHLHGATHPVEMTFMRKSGERFPVLISPTVMHDENDEPFCIFATIKDVSEQKRAERELAQTNARLSRSLDGVVYVLSAAVELRDPYTAGHQRRVAALADAIAGRLSYRNGHFSALHMAARVHDVGKIAVPAELLSKPGRLSDAEFSMIRGHSQVGYDLLAPVDFALPVAETVLQHHERLDGSGYPRGLKGDEILPEARILAVADVVEAMITHRPYRPALPLEEALAEIGPDSRGRFDADAAEACRQLFEEEGFTLPE
jgi:PAS domain S-box-containing protein